MNKKFDIDLSNKVVVITGAGGVICGAIAMELAKSGAKIALLDLNLDSAKQMAQNVRDNGGIAAAYECNVLSKISIKEARDVIMKEFGGCDILINGAGGNNARATTDNEFASFKETAENDFFALDEKGVEFVFNLNFLGTFLPCQVFMKDMIGKKGCCVLNISSMNSFTPLTKIPAYSASKASISNFTEWLSVHFAKVGVRVNAIAPGFFATKQNERLLFNEKGELSARSNKIISATPMERFGEIAELMGAVKLLISEQEASFITGVVLPVDGGFNAYSGV